MQYITDVIRKDMCEIITTNFMLLTAAARIFTHEKKNINFELLLIDYYNTLMIKKNMHTLDDDDIKFLELVNNSKVEDLRSLNANLNFVRNAFIATVNFNSLASLDKYQTIRIAYQEKEDNDLTNRPLYKLNYIASNLSPKSEDIISCYKEYLEINGDGLINHDSARDIIVNYLYEMRENDFEDYKTILLQAIPVYYKWGKYTMSKCKKETDMISKIFLRRIEWLKQDDLLQLTKYDNDFLIDIITQYLYFESLPKDITQETEEYSNKKLSKRMKRKLDNIKKTTKN